MAGGLRCDLRDAKFERSNIEKVDFRTSFNYSFDPDTNRIKKAKFSILGIPGLLNKYDIQIDVIRPHIASGKFTVIEITEDEITEIKRMSLEETRLSEQDWSAIFYAQNKQAFVYQATGVCARLRTQKD